MTTRRTSFESPKYLRTFPEGSRFPLAMSETKAADTPRWAAKALSDPCSLQARRTIFLTSDSSIISIPILRQRGLTGRSASDATSGSAELARALILPLRLKILRRQEVDLEDAALLGVLGGAIPLPHPAVRDLGIVAPNDPVQRIANQLALVVPVGL